MPAEPTTSVGTRKAADKVAIAARREQVAEMYVRKIKQADIAEELGVSQPTIALDLKAIQKMWLESTLRNFDKAKAEQLAKIDEVERNAWLGWERSVGEHVKRRYKLTPKGVERERLVEELAGNSAFLRVVLDCVRERSELMGLNAPVKQEISLTFSDENTLDEHERRLGIGSLRWHLPHVNPN